MKIAVAERPYSHGLPSQRLVFLCGLEDLLMDAIIFLQKATCRMVHHELPNQCHFSYERCLCDTLPNITHISKNCITHLQLHSSRILPPISYVLQVLVVRELFTLSAECGRSSLHMAWTASSLILIGIIIGMYWSNCAYSIIMFCIFATSSLLGFTFIYDCQRERAPRNRDAPGDMILAPQQLQSTENHVTPWNELI